MLNINGSASGYAYVYEPGPGGILTSENWEIEVYAPSGDETDLGPIWIDHCLCRMFASRDGKFRAVNAVNAKDQVGK